MTLININIVVAISFFSLLVNTANATPSQKLAMLSSGEVISFAQHKKSKRVLPKRKKRNAWACLRNIDIIRREAQKINTIIIRSSQKYSVDANLIKAVIAVESCYNSRAVSPAGAEGLMQLIPATADRFGVTNSFDVKQNVNAGTKYLRFLLDRFDGDLQKVTAGYNAGEGRVDQYKGIPPFPETRNYVKNVLRIFNELTGNYNNTPLIIDDGLVNKDPTSYKGMSAKDRAILSGIRSLGVKSKYRKKYISSYKAPKNTSVYKRKVIRSNGYKKPTLGVNRLSPRKQRKLQRLRALQNKLHIIRAKKRIYALAAKSGR
jgi:hypothetical protein